MTDVKEPNGAIALGEIFARLEASLPSERQGDLQSLRRVISGVLAGDDPTERLMERLLDPVWKSAIDAIDKQNDLEAKRQALDAERIAAYRDRTELMASIRSAALPYILPGLGLIALATALAIASWFGVLEEVTALWSGHEIPAEIAVPHG